MQTQRVKSSTQTFWLIDPAHSTLEFTVKNLFFLTVKGCLTDLRSRDFLETELYPAIHFQSSKVEPGKDRDTLRLTGSLNIRGKDREIVLDVNEVDFSRSPQGEEVIYYSATTELNRFDFGVRYGRGIIGRTLKVTINVQASRQP